jgi:hypothetical protein
VKEQEGERKKKRGRGRGRWEQKGGRWFVWETEERKRRQHRGRRED